MITGASKGIGFGLASSLIQSGEKVIATSRSYEKLKNSFKEFIHLNNIELIPWDLSDINSLEEYSRIVIEKVGPLSGLVHCAGFSEIRPLGLVNENYLEKIFRIHSYSPIMLCSLFSKQGRYIKDEFSIVLISSLAAHEGAPGRSAYAAAKGSLEGFLAPAASELIQRGIRINVVIPGLISTEMTNEYLSLLSENEEDQILIEYPLGIGEVEDVVEMILFLLGPRSKWITGQKFILDGGHLIRK